MGIPVEGALNPSSTSLPRRRSKAWPAFAEKLAAALRALEEDQHLVLCAKRSNRFVQFVCQGSFGMRTETVSNHYLKESERLDDLQLVQLAKAGWSAPTRDPRESTPETDPDGSPNFFIDFEAPVDFQVVAQLAVHTLADILRVPHPGFLAYDAFESGKDEIQFAGLGLKRIEREPTPKHDPTLRDAVLACVRQTTGIREIHYDKDGDIPLRFRGHTSHLRIVRDGRFVRLFSVIALGVEQSPQILEMVNDLNRTVPRIQFWFYQDAILADMDVAAAPFVSAHIEDAMNEFCSTVAGVSIELVKKLKEGGDLPSATPRTLH